MPTRIFHKYIISIFIYLLAAYIIISSYNTLLMCVCVYHVYVSVVICMCIIFINFLIHFCTNPTCVLWTHNITLCAFLYFCRLHSRKYLIIIYQWLLRSFNLCNECLGKLVGFFLDMSGYVSKYSYYCCR